MACSWCWRRSGHSSTELVPGDLPSVTTFLSDGVVEVSSQGLRRRMAVVAGDAFWFEARTRLTVIDDYPVGAAILQITPR